MRLLLFAGDMSPVIVCKQGNMCIVNILLPFIYNERINCVYMVSTSTAMLAYRSMPYTVPSQSAQVSLVVVPLR